MHESLETLRLFVPDPEFIVLDCFTFQHELFFERLFCFILQVPSVAEFSTRG